MCYAHDLELALCQQSDSFPSYSVPQHSRSPIQISIDGWHLVEALGIESSFISQGDFNREWVEYIPTSDFLLSVWICSQVFACHMSSVILTDIILTVLETSDCFLSNTNNTMHILATETEEQDIYSGHHCAPFIQATQQLIQATQQCPCSHKMFNKKCVQWLKNEF